MGLFKRWFAVASFLLLATSVVKADALSSPIDGNWLTIDDRTAQPRSIVQISEGQYQQFQGKIIKIYYRAGESATDICKKCDGHNKNQPFIGMTMLWDMQAIRHNEWGKGEVQDPQNGKIYHCLIKLSQDQQKLYIRGYIGMPLLGRTQTWLRTE